MDAPRSGNAHGRGKVIVIAAPSGAGKTSIAKEILRSNPSLQFSVSATTRPIRAGEVDGRDYVFLSRDVFLDRVGRGEFVEWEEIYGDLYGTLQEQVDAALAQGISLVFDVDVKGALSIKRRYPDAVLIFIQPPSAEVLEQRLRSRHTEDPAALERRLARVPMELAQAPLFDYRVANDTLERAIAEVQTIVHDHVRKSH